MFVFKITFVPKNSYQHEARRIVHIPENANLGELVETIEKSMEWSGLCISWFITRDNIKIPDYENNQEHKDLYKMKVVDHLDLFPLEYEYNLLNLIREGWMHHIEYHGMVTGDEEKFTCVYASGLAPPENKEDDYEFTPSVLDEIYHANLVDIARINKSLMRIRKYSRLCETEIEKTSGL
jgi:hypothetical protein